jgi:hypothetical protein
MNLDTKDKELEELLEKKKLDKKKKRVENLLRNYKINKSRLKILELGLVNYQDRTLNGIDYSIDPVQTSNIVDLSNGIVVREAEMIKLVHDIGVADALIDSLNEKDRFLIWQFYIEVRTQIQIANDMNYYDVATVWRNRERIIKNLMELV